MKWLVVVISVFCFSALAEVVCKDPSNQGDESTEANEIISNCRPSATASVGNAVSRDGNEATHVATLIEGTATPTASSSSGTTGTQTGTQTGIATGNVEDDSDTSNDGSTSGDGSGQQ